MIGLLKKSMVPMIITERFSLAKSKFSFLEEKYSPATVLKSLRRKDNAVIFKPVGGECFIFVGIFAGES